MRVGYGLSGELSSWFGGARVSPVLSLRGNEPTTVTREGSSWGGNTDSISGGKWLLKVLEGSGGPWRRRLGANSQSERDLGDSEDRT